MDRFFKNWKAEPYRFESEQALDLFNKSCVKPQGAIILWRLVYETKRHLNLDLRHKLQARSMYTPDMIRPALTKYENGGVMGSFDKQVLKDAYALVRRMFLLENKVAPIDVSEVPFDPTTNAGLPTLGKKRDNIQEALAEVKAIRRGKAPAPLVTFHRGKNEEQARPVFGYPFSMSLIEGQFFYPFQDALLKQQTPYAGGSYKATVAKKLNEIAWQSRFYAEFDYSGFDGSISCELISMAFRIIAQSVKFETEQQREDWELIKRYFCTAPIVAPDGMVYKGRRHGVPSGSTFTQLIDSIVNALVLVYTGLRLNWSVTRMTVLGDDSIVGFSSPPGDLRTIQATMAELGIRLNAEKSAIKTVDEDIHFLGHTWSNGLPVRDVEETLLRCFCPERSQNAFFTDEYEEDYVQAVVERCRAYQQDNVLAWGQLQVLIDALRHPDVHPKFYGKINDNQEWAYLPVEKLGFRQSLRAVASDTKSVPYARGLSQIL